jgi:hypothetical protein
MLEDANVLETKWRPMELKTMRSLEYGSTWIVGFFLVTTV